MNARRMRTTAAAVLALLLAAPAAALAQSTAPAKPAPDRPAAAPRARVLHDALGLTAEQQKKLEELRAGRLDEMRKLRGEMTKLGDELEALRADPKSDLGKMDALIDRMARLRADREKAALRSQRAWESVFTPEQLAKLKSYRSGRESRFGHGRMLRHSGRAMERGFGRRGFGGRF